MHRLIRTFAVSAISLGLVAAPAFAQDHHDDHPDHDRDNHHYVHHDDWHRGSHIRHEDWDRGERVDWHAHHLRRPPNGYEWREVDGNYVMAAIATGVIASVIIASQQPH